MPLCTLHLLSVHTTTPDSLSTFLSTLQSSHTSPLIVSRVIRWIILPSHLSTSTLLAQNVHWDILLVLPNTNPLPASLQKLIQNQWSVIVGVPSRLLQDFKAKNERLLHPDAGTVPELSGALEDARMSDSAQGLELSDELQGWVRGFREKGGVEGRGAMSMLNLLSFQPGMKDSYLQYGRAFSESIGSKRGGNAKIVGSVVDVNGVKKEEGDGGWDEVALVHYPSITHFADMLVGEDYQEVNKKFRVPALGDTFIICTSEIGVEDVMGRRGRSGVRL